MTIKPWWFRQNLGREMQKAGGLHEFILHYKGQVFQIRKVDAEEYSRVVLLSDMTNVLYNDPDLWKVLDCCITAEVPGRTEKMLLLLDDPEGGNLGGSNLHVSKDSGLCEKSHHLDENSGNMTASGFEMWNGVDVGYSDNYGGLLLSGFGSSQVTINGGCEDPNLAMAENFNTNGVNIVGANVNTFLNVPEVKQKRDTSANDYICENGDFGTSQNVGFRLTANGDTGTCESFRENTQLAGEDVTNANGEEEQNDESGETEEEEISDCNDSDEDFDDDPFNGCVNRKALYEYSISWGFTIIKFVNEKTRVTSYSNGEECNWRAHASVCPDGVTCAVKTCQPIHTCQVNPNLTASVRWMAEKVLDLVRADRGVKIDILRDSLIKLGVHPSNKQLFRARTLATEMLDGNHGESWKLLPTYFEMVKQSIRGTVVKIEYKMQPGKTIPNIMRAFLGFKPLANAGRIDAVDDKVPHAIHRNCSHHILSNFRSRFPEATLWVYDVTPRVIKQLKANAQASRTLKFWCSQDKLFEVREENKSFVVKLDEGYCNCKEWNHTGIPCRHACVVILNRREKSESYCDSSLSKTNYLRTYNQTMLPVKDQSFWLEFASPQCLPPLTRRRSGRPTNKRKKSAHEEPMKRSSRGKCGKCGEYGHNTRTCAGGPVKTRKGYSNKKLQNANGAAARGKTKAAARVENGAGTRGVARNGGVGCDGGGNGSTRNAFAEIGVTVNATGVGIIEAGIGVTRNFTGSESQPNVPLTQSSQTNGSVQRPSGSHHSTNPSQVVNPGRNKRKRAVKNTQVDNSVFPSLSFVPDLNCYSATAGEGSTKYKAKERQEGSVVEPQLGFPAKEGFEDLPRVDTLMFKSEKGLKKDWYMVKRNLVSGSRKIVEAYSGSCIWKPNFLDLEKLERYPKILGYGAVQHFVPVMPIEGLEADKILGVPFKEKEDDHSHDELCQEVQGPKRMLSSGGMITTVEEINIASMAYGGHAVAVEGLKSEKPIKAKWLKQFLKENPKKTTYEALVRGLCKLTTGQLPLGPGEESAVTKVSDEDFGIDLEEDEDETVEEDDIGNSGAKDQDPPTVRDTGGAEEGNPSIEESSKDQPRNDSRSQIVRFRQKEEEYQHRLQQYDLDYQDSLILEANINEEMANLRNEKAQLKHRERITVSPWFLKKFHILSLVEKQIQNRTECFIAAIEMLKKRTKEAKFYSRQSVVLQNILVDHEIPLPILEGLDEHEKAHERTAAEEFLLRLDEQDWEIADLKDKLN
ncbi:OLC1v1008806C1 [Oldenlandia corymbosa var. corymbosa]|uniref:OLC1v1008806C1 n=1 Tax=Oldenlandia corymbosa var. corymbosa TaxID=529605 RepID=A0AAV1DNZ7_OLDCO|nr:OLC1v1008806C1 [Oldenlandia corymbosa var. corymbosa]